MDSCGIWWINCSFNDGKLKGPAENRTVRYWLELKEDNDPNMAITGEGEFSSDSLK